MPTGEAAAKSRNSTQRALGLGTGVQQRRAARQVVEHQQRARRDVVRLWRVVVEARVRGQPLEGVGAGRAARRPLAVALHDAVERVQARAAGKGAGKQQRSSGAVEGAAAVAMQTMAFGGGPAAGVFIHQCERQLEVAGQPFAVAAAVLGLFGRLLAGIER
mgnify:CR=1 FL=1